MDSSETQVDPLKNPIYSLITSLTHKGKNQRISTEKKIQHDGNKVNEKQT